MSNKYAAYQKKWWSLNREYITWSHMLQRCNNPESNRYYLYGARGIKVKYSSYERFLADVGRKPSPKHTIDRIDNSGHYEEGNCRWATYSEQNSNRRKYKHRRK